MEITSMMERNSTALKVWDYYLRAATLFDDLAKGIVLKLRICNSQSASTVKSLILLSIRLLSISAICLVFSMFRVLIIDACSLRCGPVCRSELLQLSLLLNLIYEVQRARCQLNSRRFKRLYRAICLIMIARWIRRSPEGFVWIDIVWASAMSHSTCLLLIRRFILVQ